MKDNSDGRVTVCIHDEGGQIPLNAMPHLFDRFYRADSSRSKSTGGMGLGLAISKEIVLRHAGKIEIKSNPAEGTCVFVHLPKI